MYTMKPIYQNSENIDIPDVMYKMKGLHAENKSTCGSSSVSVLKCIADSSILACHIFVCHNVDTYCGFA